MASPEYQKIRSVLLEIKDGASVNSTVQKNQQMVLKGQTSADDGDAGATSDDGGADAASSHEIFSHRVASVDMRLRWHPYPNDEKENFKNFYMQLKEIEKEHELYGPTEELVESVSDAVSNLDAFCHSPARQQLEAYTKRFAWQLDIPTYDEENGLRESPFPADQAD